MNKLDLFTLIIAFVVILSIPAAFLIFPNLVWEFRDEPSRPGDYWYEAPDGVYWAYTGEIYSNVTHNYAYFTACPSSGTQLHCGPFGWNVEVAYNHPYGENSTKIHLVLVNNTVVKIQD